jgi:hypothetical protein
MRVPTAIHEPPFGAEIEGRAGGIPVAARVREIARNCFSEQYRAARWRNQTGLKTPWTSRKTTVMGNLAKTWPKRPYF